MSRAAAAGGVARMRRLEQTAPEASTQEGVLKSSVEDFAALAERERIALRQADRLADRIAAIAGSLPFAVLNGLFFAGWLLINSRLGGMPAFDPYPFGALTVIVSLEAIFLAIFVLMSQNRQTVASDRRARIDMHVDAIAEREITKVLELLHELRGELGVQRSKDTELHDMMRRTDVHELVEAVQAVEERVDGTNHAEAGDETQPTEPSDGEKAR
jgi:uncharacterized membrane protein